MPVEALGDPPIGAVLGGTIKAGLLNLIGLGIKYSPTPRGRAMRATGMSYHFSVREDPNSDLGVSVGREIKFNQSGIQDAGHGALSALDLAPLSPSKGGVVTFARTPGIVASDIAKTITKNFNNLQCTQCADAMVSAFKKEGISGQVVTLNANQTKRGFIYSTKADDIISRSGMHQGVLIEGKVYDNIHKNGINYNDWLKDFNVLGGFKEVKKRDF